MLWGQKGPRNVPVARKYSYKKCMSTQGLYFYFLNLQNVPFGSDLKHHQHKDVLPRHKVTTGTVDKEGKLTKIGLFAEQSERV